MTALKILSYLRLLDSKFENVAVEGADDAISLSSVSRTEVIRDLRELFKHSLAAYKNIFHQSSHPHIFSILELLQGKRMPQEQAQTEQISPRTILC